MDRSSIPSTKCTDGWLGWAVFLGISWTWCIGMFLPVLVVHDFGVWGWVVFAMPNVVGAAAMGWTIDTQRSHLMVAAHRPAMIVFSTITIAFQIFFAVWVFSRPPWQDSFCLWYLTGIALVAILAMARKSSRVLATIILVASVACAVGMFLRGEARLTSQGIASNLNSAPTPALMWFAPAFLLGFLFCPYLDLTFHRARQHLDDRNAKRSFGFGFGVVFLSAIILTLLYAKPVYAAMNSNQNATLILRWVKVYWMLQLGFTIGVHLIGDDAENDAPRTWAWGAMAISGAVIAAGALAIGQILTIPGEKIYRAFFVFYGLVFPAYVWLVVLPGRGLQAPTRRSMAVLGIAIAGAMPLLYLAFMEKRFFWATPGVAVVLLSRVLLSRSTGTPQRDAEMQLANQQNSAPTS